MPSLVAEALFDGKPFNPKTAQVDTELVADDGEGYIVTEDLELHCLHWNHEIEAACCSGFSGGLPSCACGGMDAVGCPNRLCDGITDDEVMIMLTPEEPDYEPYE